MEPIKPENITLDKIDFPVFRERDLECHVLRLDKIHPVISGNKWFKLKFYLEKAISEKKKTIVTFGGSWSNHLLATAATCYLNKLGSIGIVRGEKPLIPSKTLEVCASMGMQLVFISREDYRLKNIPAEIPDASTLLIPEGGHGPVGIEGAATIADHFQPGQYTHIICAAGTGTTAAGLLHAATAGSQLLVFPVLKNYSDMEKDILHLAQNPRVILDINHDYAFGGYAKFNSELTDFMNLFYRHTGIPTDFVYTGKSFFGTCDLARLNYFPPHSKLLVIHTGGLQGNTSLRNGTLIF